MISRVKNTQQGLTLIELMVALALASILMAAIFSVVNSNNQNARISEEFADIQGSAKYALEQLSRDIRMAGYMGCVNSSDSSTVFNNIDPTSNQYSETLHKFENRIEALDNYPANGNKIGGLQPVAGTDVLMSSFGEPTNIVVSGPPIGDSLQIAGPGEQLGNIKAGMVMLVTDCYQGDIFVVSARTGLADTQLPHLANASSGLNNLGDSLTSGRNYALGSQLLLMSKSQYFIAPSSLYPGTNALYRLQLHQSSDAQELVPLVEDMQLLYSVDTNGDKQPDVYKTASQISTDGQDFNRDVYAVNVQLVLTGRSDVGANALPGYSDDGVMRKRYTRLVQIRNAGLGISN